MNKTATALMLAAAAACADLPAAERPQDRWNLADIYASTEAWNADAAKVEAELPGIAVCRGHLAESARRLKECLDLDSDVAKRAQRLATYSSELYAENTGNPAAIGLRQRAQVLGTKIGEATSYMNPEILAAGRERIDAFMREETGLKTYAQTLDNILRRAPHTLDNPGEALLATFQLAAGQGGSIYGVLTNADMPWPTVKLADGKEVRIDQAAYTHYRELANRDDRKKVFDAFWGEWKQFERSFGVGFYGMLKEDTVYTKVRKYPDTISRKLDNNRIPPAVYDALIKATNDSLPTLHRYFKLRAKMLGVSEMRYFDIYPPLVGAGREYPIDEGVRLMLGAVKPLGPEYVAAMRKGIEDRWMDVYPRQGKQSGAHMHPGAYDVHPYLLLNYTNNYASVSTLAHEWGHAMHSYYSNRSQPFADAYYAIFVAEIASTFNQALLLDHMLKGAKSDDERLLYLGSALENLRGTFFRQAMFADFEREVHARVDRGESVTGEDLTKLYGDMLRRYHGDPEGVVKIDDLYTVEWAYISHFYSSFYVFQYATSIAASSLLAEWVLEGRPGARERYMKLLAAGSSGYPYEIVKAAGVDLATREPYDALVRRMNRIMDEMDAILARRK